MNSAEAKNEIDDFKSHLTHNINKEDLLKDNKKYYQVFFKGIPLVEIRPAWYMNEETKGMCKKFLLYDIMYDIHIDNEIFNNIDDALTYAVDHLYISTYREIYLSNNWG